MKSNFEIILNLILILIIFIVFCVMVIDYIKTFRITKIKNKNIKVGQFYELNIYSRDPFDEKNTFIGEVIDIKYNIYNEKYIKIAFKDGSGLSISGEDFINQGYILTDERK